MQTETFDLPDFWAVPLMYGDTTGLTDEDESALSAFEDWMTAKYGSCHCVDVSSNGDDFRRFHDASKYGVPACNVETFTFDVTPDLRSAGRPAPACRPTKRQPLLR